MCKGLTKSGRPCLRKCEYCVYHRPKSIEPIISKPIIPKPEQKSIQKFIVGEECCVCLEENIIQKTYCGHSVCNECINKLDKNLCPMCRRDVTIIPEASPDVFEMKDLFYALDENSYYIENDGESFIIQID